ncbi:MAG: heavy metal translocating P-type ATPase [Bacilli bacterium]
MSKKQIKKLIRIIVSFVLFIILFICDLVFNLGNIIQNNKISWILPFVLYLSIYLLIGYDVLLKAIKNIFKGQIFDENFLMIIATIGAFGIKEYAEGVAVLLFYQIGEWFQDYAVRKSRKSISSLMDIRPDFANLKQNDGTYEIVDPSVVNIDDIILVKPGEKVPLDGIIINGESSLDTKALTGESLPLEVANNSKVLSGSLNLTGTIEIKVEKTFYNSTVSKILDLVENAASKKSKSENFISKFARVYTPLVVIGAFLLALIGGLITNDWLNWIERSLNFLVVSCPCALVISIPLSFFAGIGGASKNGILIKGSSYMEKLNKANIFVFDKTGTLTKGNFVITSINPESNKDKILKYAAIAEANSIHPIALSIKEAYGKKVDTNYQLINILGKGIIAKGKETIICGNEKLLEENNIRFEKNDGIGTLIYVAVNNKFLGTICISDEIKSEAKDTINYLNSIGAQSIMLTGDNEKIASSVANNLNLTNYKSSLLPQNKVEELDKILENKNKNDVVCFVGDGINDAPVLMKSDIGISMGGVGSDAAIEASDVVIMNDNLNAICKAKKIAKKTLLIVNENIVFALGIKAIVLILSILGLANMWLAIIADVGVSFIAILNAMRANSKKY